MFYILHLVVSDLLMVRFVLIGLSGIFLSLVMATGHLMLLTCSSTIRHMNWFIQISIQT